LRGVQGAQDFCAVLNTMKSEHEGALNATRRLAFFCLLLANAQKNVVRV
jgi:hypothetical protein